MLVHVCLLLWFMSLEIIAYYRANLELYKWTIGRESPFFLNMMLGEIIVLSDSLNHYLLEWMALNHYLLEARSSILLDAEVENWGYENWISEMQKQV